jgi:predicted ribosome quality control (RQC) complex YloA/Tae2 family protein
MIQYYRDIESQVKIISGLKLAGGQIQKIYSTAYYIAIAVRSPGKTYYLYLSRGGGYEGVWTHSSPPPSALRRKDNFLEYFRKHLSSCGFLNLEIDKYDRIVSLSYQKYGQRQTLMLFWKARKLYFLHYYLENPDRPYRLLLSWHGRAISPPEEPDDLFSFFDEVGRSKEMRHDFTTELRDVAALLELEMKSAQLKTQLASPSFLQRKKENIEADLRRARQWERLQSLLDHDKEIEGYEIKVGDHKIKFEGELNPYERRDLVFKKIKKLKRGESILSERLKNIENELEGKNIQPKVISVLPMMKPVWGREEREGASSEEPKKNDEFKVFKGDNWQIGVGLNAHGNDQLRSRWGKKEDHWFHLDGHKSTHVVLKCSGNPSSDLINLAASIVAHFSHFEADWIPIIFTQIKNLKGVTGAPGMVIYKKEKHLNCPRLDIRFLVKD